MEEGEGKGLGRSKKRRPSAARAIKQRPSAARESTAITTERSEGSDKATIEHGDNDRAQRVR